MAYDINVALERLEKNLQDISSAKQQVEDTVNASSQLQNVVNNYVASINDVLQETLRLKEEIGKMGDQKVTEIKEAVDLSSRKILLTYLLILFRRIISLLKVVKY